MLKIFCMKAFLNWKSGGILKNGGGVQNSPEKIGKMIQVRMLITDFQEDEIGTKGLYSIFFRL